MTARQILMEGNEGCSFIDVINNLTEDQILDCMHEYAKLKCKKLLEIVAEKAQVKTVTLPNGLNIKTCVVDEVSIYDIDLEEFWS